MEFNKEELEQSIADRFRKIVKKYPERFAIQHEDRAFSYDQLNKASNRVSHAILARRETGE
jgi:non-ribosomal peptide synthetase component F